jgi:dihydroxyacetone kinase-like protein
MKAALGRAARLGERSLGHPDPGAVSAAMVVGAMCAALCEAQA